MSTKKRTTRSVRHTYSYGPFLRIADRIAGGADRGLVAEAVSDRPVVTPFVTRMAATYAELDHSRLAAARDDARPFVQKLEETVRLIQAFEFQIAVAEKAVVEAENSPLRESRNGGEVHFTPAMMRMKAVREHQAGVARARSAVSDLERRKATLEESAASLKSELIERFTMAAEESCRHCAFFNRRLGTYARLARMTAGQTPQLELAEWVEDRTLWFPQQVEAPDVKELAASRS